MRGGIPRIVTHQYETTLEDLAAWHAKYVQQPAWVQKFKWDGLLTAVGGGLAVTVLILLTGGNRLLAPVLGGSATLIFWPLAGGLLRMGAMRYLRRTAAKNSKPPALGDHTLEVSSEGLTETSGSFSISVRWDAVAEITHTDDHLFIILNTLGTIVVPFRSFATQAQYLELIVAMTKCMKEAKAPSSSQ